MKKEDILYYYKVLGLNERANDNEIKKMYRKLILIWHLDKNINSKEESGKKTKEITEAYRIITEYREKFNKTKNSKPKPKSKPKTKKQPKQKQKFKPKSKPIPKPKQKTKKQQKFTKNEQKMIKEVD